MYGSGHPSVRDFNAGVMLLNVENNKVTRKTRLKHLLSSYKNAKYVERFANDMVILT